MKKRYLSLDILRGLTVALMIVVNNPGSWGNIFPPLRHAEWDGWMYADRPGVSIFSILRRNINGFFSCKI